MKATFVAALAAGALLFGGCSSSKSASDTTSAASVESTAAPATDASETSSPDSSAPTVPGTDAVTQAVTDVSVPPGLSDDKFVGAAGDVTTKQCEPVGGAWKVAGTVTNKSGKDASYRIYVALNRKGTTDTRALVQTNAAVKNGESKDWGTSVKLADKDLVCILRVERTASP